MIYCKCGKGITHKDDQKVGICAICRFGEPRQFKSRFSENNDMYKINEYFDDEGQVQLFRGKQLTFDD